MRKARPPDAALLAEIRALRDELVERFDRLERALGAGEAPKAEPRWITAKDAARRCKVSHDTMCRWARERDIGERWGSQWRIDEARLDAFLIGFKSENLQTASHDIRATLGVVSRHDDPMVQTARPCSK